MAKRRFGERFNGPRVFSLLLCSGEEGRFPDGAYPLVYINFPTDGKEVEMVHKMFYGTIFVAQCKVSISDAMTIKRAELAIPTSY